MVTIMRNAMGSTQTIHDFIVDQQSTLHKNFRQTILAAQL